MEDKFSNSYISRLFRNVAAAYEVKGSEKFKVRAYENVAASIEHYTSEVHEMWKEGRLREVPGVGAGIEAHLNEYFKTGKISHFEELFSEVPAAMFDLFGIQGIGAKTAYKLSVGLKLKSGGDSLAEVQKAAREGKIRDLEGFGEEKERDILEAIEKLKPSKLSQKRMLLPLATVIAERIERYMKENPEVKAIIPLGSLRRRVVTIGDIDFAVNTTNPASVLAHFVAYPDVSEILNHGDVKASVILKNGVKVDLMTESGPGFGSLLQHFTGSKAHNIALRELALKKGMSLSEHGIKHREKLHVFDTEDSFYKYIGLTIIPPEIREASGEIEASLENSLPKLVELRNIKGDLHSHTTFSDGQNTLEEMIAKAKSLKYQYLGVSDHAPSAKARGDAEVLSIIKDTRKRIESFNTSDGNMRVLYGYEINILADSSMSFPAEGFRLLDYAIASIHTSFNQSRREITDRLLSALRNPYISFIGHPSGRLLNSRGSYDVDWEKVMKEALEFEKALEINSHPERLDLPDTLVREAVKKGVNLIINTDAHSVDDLDLMRYGIDVARRGWAESKNILNTLPYEEFIRKLKPKRI